MLVGALYVVSAYGLLKLQRWAPAVTTAALLLSVAWLGALIGLDPAVQRPILFSAMIAVALAGVVILLSRKVRLLYNPVPA
jgi:hypothetical protein